MLPIVPRNHGQHVQVFFKVGLLFFFEGGIITLVHVYRHIQHCFIHLVTSLVQKRLKNLFIFLPKTQHFI